MICVHYFKSSEQTNTQVIVTKSLVTYECGAQSWTCMFTCERHTHKRTKTVRKSYLFSRLYLNVESKQDLTVIHTTALTRYQDMSNSGLYIFTDLIKAPDCEAVMDKNLFEAKLLGIISLSMQQQTARSVMSDFKTNDSCRLALFNEWERKSHETDWWVSVLSLTLLVNR